MERPTIRRRASRRSRAAAARRRRFPCILQDERLTSHEAESRLAIRRSDWRSRKQLLDAAAAAIILQDYLDAHAAASRLDPTTSIPCAD